MTDQEAICGMFERAEIVFTVEVHRRGSMISVAGDECCRTGKCSEGKHVNEGYDDLKFVLIFDSAGSLISLGTYHQ